jgi:hypothetical protein
LERVLLEVLGAWRDELAQLAQSVGESEREQARWASSEVLLAEWLLQQYAERGLLPPYFLGSELGPTANASFAPIPDPDGRAWYEVRAGEAIAFNSDDYDILNFDVSTDTAVETRYSLQQGARSIAAGRLASPGASVTLRPAERTRWVVSEPGPIRLGVSSGRIRVAVHAFQAQEALEQLRPRRAPRLLLSRAAQRLGAGWGMLGQVLRTLIDAQRMRAPTLEVASESRSPRLRALLTGLDAERSLDPVRRAELLDRFWADSESFELERRAALRAWLLWNVVRSWGPLPARPNDAVRKLRWRRDLQRLPDAQRFELQALIEQALPGVGSARSSIAADLEQFVAGAQPSQVWPELARDTWQAIAPWAVLDVGPEQESSLTWEQPVSTEPSGQCPFEGPEGLRWSILGALAVGFEATVTTGTHQQIWFHPFTPSEHGQAPGDSTLSVDGAEFGVLPLFGVGSGLGVMAGEHHVRVSSGPAVLARLPRSGQAPCETLRSPKRWLELTKHSSLALPFGRVATVARVTRRELPALVQAAPQAAAAPAPAVEKVNAELGPQRFQLWLTPGSSAELPVSSEASELSLGSEHALWVRVQVRQQPIVVRAEAAHGVGSTSQKAVAQGTNVPPAPSAVTAKPSNPEPELMSPLRDVTRRLDHAKAEAAVDALRAERAGLLLRLGYRKLAALDLARRSANALPIEPTLPNGEVWLPERNEPVVALDRVSLLPALSDDLDPQVLSQVYERAARGATLDAQHLLIEHGAELTEGRAALALAALLEDQAEWDRAAAIYERLGRKLGKANALARAAMAQTRAGYARADRIALGHAHLLARLAIAMGARPDPLLGPLAPVLEWDSPSLGTLGFGAAQVQQLGDPSEAPSEAAEVYAAVLDKPALARWFGPNATLSLLGQSGPLDVESRCFSRAGPSEDCRLLPELDGQLVSCEPETSNASADAAHSRHCRFALPQGARRLRWRAEGAMDPVGWLLVRAPAPTGEWQPLAQGMSYVEATPSVPIRFDVLGPAVLRLTARSVPGRAARITVEVNGSNPHDSKTSLQLPVAADPDSTRIDVPAPVALSATTILVVDEPGVHAVTIRSDAESVLVRPELARIAPDLELTPEAPGAHAATATEAGATSAASHYPGPAELTPRVRDEALTSGLSVSADTAVVEQIETEDNTQDLRLQAGVTLRKALIEDQWWIRTELQGRKRTGPSSGGLEVYTSWAAQETSPGLYGRFRVSGQEAPDAPGGRSAAIGAFAEFGASRQFVLTRKLMLIPALTFSLRHADPLVRGITGLDTDVYSAYTWSHPRSFEIQLGMAHRPRYDTLTQTTVLVRLNPNFDAVDEVIGEFEFQWLGGAGYWPWFAWQTSLAWHTANELRDIGFVRLQSAPSAFVWRWLSNGDRIRAKVSCGAYWDEPSRSAVQPALFAFLGLGYDFAGGAGLRDFLPFERPYRRRLEEGSGRESLEQGYDNPYWRHDPQNQGTIR